MAPTCLFVDVWVVVAEAYSNYVVRTDYLLYGPYDECLRFTLWEVTSYEGCVNPEFRRVADALVVGDANL